MSAMEIHLFVRYPLLLEVVVLSVRLVAPGNLQASQALGHTAILWAAAEGRWRRAQRTQA